MPIVGFTFTKMEVANQAPPTGQISIDNNIAIKNVEERSLSFGKENHSGLRFVFEFSVKYIRKLSEKNGNSTIGQIGLQGEVLFYDSVEKMESIKSEWKNNKKVPADIAKQLLNTTMNKCNVAALGLSRDVNLPSPFPLPRVRADQL